MQRIARSPHLLSLLLLFTLATTAQSAPLRILPPGRDSSMPGPALCTAEILAERLAQCQGIDIIHGDRAAHVNNYLHSGALELTEDQSWKILSSYVSIDAMITVVGLPEEGSPKHSRPHSEPHAEPDDATVEVRIFRAGGLTRIRANIEDAKAARSEDAKGLDLPHAVADLAARVGRELKLGEADIKLLSEVRVEDPALFRLYYVTRTGSYNWPVNPYVAPFIWIADMHSSSTDWALDALTVRVIANYLDFATHGRQADKLPQAVSMVRSRVLRLLGTPHDEETYPLMHLQRLTPIETMMADLELTLLQIAQPLGAGAAPTLGGHASGGAGGGGGGDVGKDLDELAAAKPADKTGLHDVVDTPTDLSTRTGQTSYTSAQRLSALRMLGEMASPKALLLLDLTAQSKDAAVRQATAAGLARFKGDVGLDVLTRLSSDADENVAFTAGRILAQRKHAPADFRKRALAMLDKGEPNRTLAAEALASDPTLEDHALLDRLAADPAPAVRAALHATRIAGAGASTQVITDVLLDADAEVVINTIRHVPPAAIVPGGDLFNTLAHLANDPDASVAQTAMDALWPLRPAASGDALARAQFDLAIAPPYLRHKAVAALKASKDPAARAALIAACDNLEPHTRAAALEALAELDPAAARAPLAKALADPHLYVRFRAATLLAPIADAAQAEVIRQAIPHQKDHATALYLADALAHASGSPPPPPQPPANTVTGASTIAWLWGPNLSEVDSPYRAYFKPSHGNHVRDDAIGADQKKAHAAGKSFFYNISPGSEPGTMLVDPAGQDHFWLYLDNQLDTPNLPWIDGLDYGTGDMQPDALWTTGWRFFCDETGIDPKRVAADRKKLNPYESHAWTVWALRLCVEGRNRLYDYTKLKFGRLHPGIQICTSLDLAGDPFERDWKFDFAICLAPGITPGSGGMPPNADTRKDVFNLVRRAKTTWPDRPVFWLGDGLKIEKLATIQYTFKAADKPLTGRGYLAYTEALAAWMAGADPGWGCIWCFRTPDWADPDFSGAVVTPENISPDSPALHAGIDLAFNNVEPLLRDKDAMAKAHAKSPALAPDAKDAQMDNLIDTVVQGDGPNPMVKRIEREKEAMYLGFQFYGKHLLDIARLFASLPRNNVKSDALVIQPCIADTSTPVASPLANGTSGSDLLSYYDYALDINAAPQLDLKRYRFIAVHDPSALTDETIAAITAWLRETPGVLYVHLDLTADNSRLAATPEHFDGKLKLDWPWEENVAVGPAPKPAPVKPDALDGAETPETQETPEAQAAKLKKASTLTSSTGTTVTLKDGKVARTYKLTGTHARPLLTNGDAVALALWQRPDFKGAVVFDGIDGADKAYRQELARVLNELKAKSGVGIELAGPARHEALANDQWAVDTTAGSDEGVTPKGNDLLTGELNPVVGPANSGAFISRNFQGKYAAGYNGVTVLCDRPIRHVEKIEGGLRIECEGLIQAASATGKLEAKAASGPPIPEVPAAKFQHWEFLETSEGLATEPVGDGPGDHGSVVYVRCNRGVTLLTK